ncbi:hypothetical protein OpiT1DRAFT_01321 [Opitutaceae bacterium TAV1]|nr:hypothetical protein OpiT1DRAFT_01321 [Opitutaceae bacterium TAV1]
MKPATVLAAFAALLVFAAAVRAQQQPDNSIELRLREALRSTTLQLRAAESERAALQVERDELARERDTLKKQNTALARQAAADRDAAAGKAADLSARLAAEEKKSAELAATLAESRESAARSADLARLKENARATLEIRVAELERIVAARETANIELFKLGSEILGRLESFGLGDAIKNREPFVGVKRVQLQNLVQDYQDKLLDQKTVSTK